MEKPYSDGVEAIFEVVHRLRAPGGCPWDREQTHESLRPYLLEETYELLEAIDSGDDAKMMEELGDLLLQVAMHAEIAAEEGRFDAKQVAEAVAAKMVKRHPHVFGDVSVANADEVLRNWEHQKMHEARKAGAHESVVDRVPSTLPALAWTLGLQKRAARVGFDFASPAAASVRTNFFGVRKAVIVLAAAVALVWAGVAFAQEAYVVHRLSQQVSDLRKQNAEIASQNTGYRKDVQGLTNGTADEEEARLNGYAKPNEKTYLVTAPASPSPATRPKRSSSPLTLAITPTSEKEMARI